MSRVSVSERDVVYQFKVTLEYTDEPLIWRRFQVEPDITLGEFSGVLVNVMGWLGGHSHTFQTRNVGTDSDPCITYHDSPEFFSDSASRSHPVMDENEVVLQQVFKRPGEDWLTWEYDTGDSWQHAVEFEEKAVRRQNAFYPRILDGAMACPPENCGSYPGFKHFKEVMANRKHAEYRRWKDWYEEYAALPGQKRYDPKRFNVTRANKKMWKGFSREKVLVPIFALPTPKLYYDGGAHDMKGKKMKPRQAEQKRGGDDETGSEEEEEVEEEVEEEEEEEEKDKENEALNQVEAQSNKETGNAKRKGNSGQEPVAKKGRNAESVVA